MVNELTAQGVGVILISSELPEVLGMSDRVMVMHEGRICGEFNRGEATQEKNHGNHSHVSGRQGLMIQFFKKIRRSSNFRGPLNIQFRCNEWT